MDEINNPHDVYFRERFTRREIAQDFLRWHLPAVYPIVLYHGRNTWHAPSDFHALVRPLPVVLQLYVPQFRYALHDLSARTNAEIKGDVLTRLVQLAMCWIFS